MSKIYHKYSNTHFYYESRKYQLNEINVKIFYIYFSLEIGSIIPGSEEVFKGSLEVEALGVVGLSSHLIFSTSEYSIDLSLSWDLISSKS